MASPIVGHPIPPAAQRSISGVALGRLAQMIDEGYLTLDEIKSGVSTFAPSGIGQGECMRSQ